jgi:hypothetical protein
MASTNTYEERASRWVAIFCGQYYAETTREKHHGNSAPMINKLVLFITHRSITEIQHQWSESLSCLSHIIKSLSYMRLDKATLTYFCDEIRFVDSKTRKLTCTFCFLMNALCSAWDVWSFSLTVGCMILGMLYGEQKDFDKIVDQTCESKSIWSRCPFFLWICTHRTQLLAAEGHIWFQIGAQKEKQEKTELTNMYSQQKYMEGDCLWSIHDNALEFAQATTEYCTF